MSDYVLEEIDAAERDRLTGVAHALTSRVRRLVEATVVTAVSEEEIAEAQRHIDAAADILSRKRLPGAFGVRFSPDGTKRAWGNAVVGARNPIAPPLDIGFDDDGAAHAEVVLGAQYEGPAGMVHGGVIALLMDQVLGAAAEHAGAPGMTGTLTIRYRQPAPLGRIRCMAAIDRIEGVKTFVRGTLSNDAGLCAEVEGVFILPRWARGKSHRNLPVGD